LPHALQNHALLIGTFEFFEIIGIFEIPGVSGNDSAKSIGTSPGIDWLCQNSTGGAAIA